MPPFSTLTASFITGRHKFQHALIRYVSRMNHPQIALAMDSISSDEKRSLQKEQKLERGITSPRAQARHGPE